MRIILRRDSDHDEIWRTYKPEQRDAEEYLEENGSAIKAVTPTHF